MRPLNKFYIIGLLTTVFNAEAIIKKSVEGRQTFDLHNFDECLRFRLDHKDHGLINGKYCVIAFNSTKDPILKYTGMYA